MTVLTDLIEDLVPFFTLKFRKDEVWKGYLNSELKYINGGVYLHAPTPSYHTQELYNVSFEAYDEDHVECRVFLGDYVSSKQAMNTVVTLQDSPIQNECSLKYSQGKPYVSVVFRNNREGLLTVSVPSYSEPLNIYKGRTFDREIHNQSMAFSGNVVRRDGNLEFNLILTNPVAKQQVKASTLLRNGNTSNTLSMDLVENQFGVFFTIPEGSQDVRLKVELKPITLNNRVTYTGDYLLIDLSSI